MLQNGQDGCVSEAVIRVLTWNILAAPWAGPRHYPNDMPIEVLDRQRRLELTCAALRNRRDGFDAIALQEVTMCDIDALHTALGRDEFEVGYAQYPAHYWAHWLDSPAQWEPNGTVLWLRRSAFVGVRFESFPIGPYGNRAVVAAATTNDDRVVNLASVHLDADDRERRLEEWESLLATIDGDAESSLIICGDLNTDTSIATMTAILTRHMLSDALTVVGNQDPTHPYARPGDSHALWARIDHVVVRGFTPIAGRVLDSGVWDLDAPAERIEALLRATGSDHHAVEVALRAV